MATPRKASPVDRILCAVAVLHAVSVTNPTRRDVARLADYPGHNDNGFKNAVNMAETAGIIECPANKQTLRLSVAGRECVPKVLPPNDMLMRLRQQEFRKKRAQKHACRILEILSDGRVHSRKSLADAIIDGPPNRRDTSSLKSAIYALRRLKILDERVKGVDGSVVLRRVAHPDSSGRTSRPVARAVMVSPTGAARVEEARHHAPVIPAKKDDDDPTMNSKRQWPSESSSLSTAGDAAGSSTKDPPVVLAVRPSRQSSKQ